MHVRVLSLSFAVLLASPLLEAAPVTGDIVAAACASCHGAKGEGKAEAGFPVLAGLPEKYLLKQLQDFRSGARVPDTGGHRALADGYPYYAHYMKGLAQSLSPHDMQTASRYFSAQTRPSTRVEATGDQLARGRELAVNGAWDRQIPPCFKCHAEGGRGVAPHFPPIAGQHALYTMHQLKAWQKGERANDPQKLMKATAEQLTDDEIRAVAAYLATLRSGGETP